MISPAPSLLEGYLANLSAADLKRAFGELLPDGASREQKIAAVLSALTSPAGALVREHMGRWIGEQLVLVEHVVPPAYEAGRAPVIGYVSEEMLRVADPAPRRQACQHDKSGEVEYEQSRREPRQPEIMGAGRHDAGCHHEREISGRQLLHRESWDAP